MRTFADIQFDAPPVILGAQLWPLTIGQALLLERLGSPFAKGAAPLTPGLGDLLLAREICRFPSPRVPSVIRMRWLSWCWRRTPAAVVLLACRQLADHVQDAFRGPPILRAVDTDERDSGVGIVAALKLGMMSRLGRSERAALETPVALALNELVALTALEGRLDLETAEDRRMAAAAREAKARLEAGENGAGRVGPFREEVNKDETAANGDHAGGQPPVPRQTATTAPTVPPASTPDPSPTTAPRLAPPPNPSAG